MAEENDSELVFVGKVVKVVGLKGEFKLATPHHEYEIPLPYPRLVIEGRPAAKVLSSRRAKGGAAVKLQGLDSIDLAQKLVGKQVFAFKEDLEMDDDEYFVSDLVGLEVRCDGKVIGEVIDIETYGASDLLRIRHTSGKTFLTPFVDEFVDEVMIDEGFINIRTLDGFLDQPCESAS